MPLSPLNVLEKAVLSLKIMALEPDEKMAIPSHFQMYGPKWVEIFEWTNWKEYEWRVGYVALEKMKPHCYHSYETSKNTKYITVKGCKRALIKWLGLKVEVKT